MSERNVLKVLSYFVLILMLVSSLFQLYLTDQTRKQQQSVLAMQSLLDLSDEFSANLGSVQQEFRSYAINPRPDVLNSLSKFQSVVNRVLKEKLALSVQYPEFKNHITKINRIFEAENKAINAYVNIHPTKMVAEESLKAVGQNERAMGMLWTELFEYRKLLKDRVRSVNDNISSISEKSFKGSVISLLLLFGVILIFGYRYIRAKKRYKAAASDLVLSNHEMLMRSLLE
ncbi:MAG: hypothetical protein EOO04_30510, partial [Chitinophagaceae bacterium]